MEHSVLSYSAFVATTFDTARHVLLLAHHASPLCPIPARQEVDLVQ